jgi:hypothetical protein
MHAHTSIYDMMRALRQPTAFRLTGSLNTKKSQCATLLQRPQKAMESIRHFANRASAVRESTELSHSPAAQRECTQW